MTKIWVGTGCARLAYLPHIHVFDGGGPYKQKTELGRNEVYPFPAEATVRRYVYNYEYLEGSL